MGNDKLSTCHENVIIKRDDKINVSPITGQGTLSKMKNFMKRDKSFRAGDEVHHLYTFKHPTIMECTQPGRCGFILRLSKPDDKPDNTGLHLHDRISAIDMHVNCMLSGSTASDNKI